MLHRPRLRPVSERARLYLAVASMLGLVAASLWLLEAMREAAGPEQGLPHLPDYYAQHFTLSMMDAQGLPRYRLRGRELVHYMDDETTRLVEPVLKVFEADAPPWRVQSERGWVSGDSKLVLLEGSVRITRRGDVHSRPIRILTSNLRVHPSEDYVEGDESVSLETPGHHVEAVGVRAWLREPSRIEFLSQVRGIHEAR